VAEEEMGKNEAEAEWEMVGEIVMGRVAQIEAGGEG
jgi:hypothetical protein